MSRYPILAIALVALCGLSACSSDVKSAESATTDSTRADSAGGLVIAPSTPYKPVDGSNPATLMVTLSGDAVAPAACASKSGAAPATVFWVDGIREGKPLPQDRRYELVSATCGIEPRIQGVVVGGTINVFNDEGDHTLVFVRAGTTDTLQSMPFSNSKSIVATERLTKTPGIVEVRCATHPNEKSYIAVFDHPYFGVGATGDKVTLDSVPAGEYRLMTWHDGMVTPLASPAKVNANGQTEVIVRQ